MRIFVLVISYLLLSTLTDYSGWSIAAIVIWVWYVINLFEKVNHTIAFREFILVMYGLNYLLSPAITYQETQAVSFYKMKLTEQEYFSLAIPAILCLNAGLYAIKTKIFSINFTTAHAESTLNQKVLLQWLMIGVFLNFIRPFLPGDLAFIIYLLSGIRYVAAFGLFFLNRKKYKWYLLGILFLEIGMAIKAGMFHDMVMWLIFFGMIWMYILKPSFVFKLTIAFVAILCFYLLQITKSDYRSKTWAGGEETGISSFSSSISKNFSSANLLSFDNFTNSLTRANQGWIFSSVVNRMNYKQDYQNLNLVKKYAEAAILPRFLAPDKMQAGDKEIFNKFSGASVSSSTTMALGLLADGYIAYAAFGTCIFTFVFGLIICLIFKVIEKWSRLSPFLALFVFPLLNYAVRADCETQTIIGHIVKGLLAFSLLIYFYKKHFKKQQLVPPEEELEKSQLAFFHR